jgi:predicted transcriptional regulator of viral defense system
VLNNIQELYKLKLFHKNDLLAFKSNPNAIKELLRRYKKQELITQIRRDYYATNDLSTKMPIASKYEIGSNINRLAYLSYHSALEYHGLANQVFYTLYISSEKQFNNFYFDGITYSFFRSNSYIGIVSPPVDSLVKVSDLERTVLDCIDKISLAGGLEELIVSLALITLIDEEKLLKYLDVFDKQFLYQKAGFILGYFSKEMGLSQSFFTYCKSKTGNSIRYLVNREESDTYFKEWQLFAPSDALSFLEQGSTSYV